MLMQLGLVTFEVYPLNTHGYTRETGYDFAAKDIMGAMRPREKMGEGDETMSIEGRVYPQTFAGGLEAIDVMHGMRSNGLPQILVRGDGRNLGWFLIEKVSERSSFIDAQGVGRIVEFTVSLTRTPKPSAQSYLSTLLRLFQ